MDDLQILSAAVFGAVLLLVAGLYSLYVDGTASRRAASRRLRALIDGAPRPSAAESLRRKRRDRIGPLTRFDRSWARLDRLVHRAGITLPLRRVALVMGIVAVMTLVALTALAGGGSAGVAALALAAAGFAVGAAAIGVAWRRARRTARLTAQLPEALDIMVRSLRAGHPVSAAMSMVSRELGEPIGAEFGLAVSEMTYGLDLRDALANLADRVAVADLQYVTVAIKIQHETGGNLAEVLHGLSTVIRARLRMRKTIRSLSAEARLSARVLAVMPVAFAGLVYASRPEFYLSAVDDPLFAPIVAAAIGLELVGILVMRRLVNFHV